MRILYFLILLSSLCNQIHAQDWQWAKRFGSTSNVKTPGYENEKIISLGNDAKGNLYVLNLSMPYSPNADGVAQTGYWDTDIMMSSFKSDGTLRWVDMIGANYSDITEGMFVCPSGNIYMGAIIPADYGNAVVHVGPGTTYNGNLNFNKDLVLAKYDSNGKCLWYKVMQDSIPYFTYPCYTGYSVFSITADQTENIYALAYLAPGSYLNRTLQINSCGYYFLKLDAFGNFLGFLPLECSLTDDAGLADIFFDSKTGHFYLWASRYSILNPPLIHVGSKASRNQDSIGSGGYVLAFNSSGKYLWKVLVPDGTISGKPVIDNEGDLYFCGGITNGGMVNKQVVKTDYYGAPYVAKIDTNGKTIWLTHGSAKYSAYGMQLAQRSSGEIVMGCLAPIISWPGCTNSLYQPLNSPYQPCIVRINTQTGKALSLELGRINIDNQDETTYMCGDKKGGVYLGGAFSDDITVGKKTVYSTGGFDDGFVVKYGNVTNSCNIPEPSYSYSFKKDSIAFKYTGTIGYTSITWDFGDGDSSSLVNPIHRFNDGDSVYSHIVCAVVVNACGDNIVCQNVTTWPTAVNNTYKGNIELYPNPLRERLHIRGLEIGDYVYLLDANGRKWFDSIVDDTYVEVDMKNAPPGVYILVVTAPNGEVRTQKLIKN